MTVTELLKAAIDRGETIESVGTERATKQDLTYYVLELVDEARVANFLDNDEPLIKDGVVAGALFGIWTEGVPNV